MMIGLDSFLVSIDSVSGTLLYSTYLGGTDDDHGGSNPAEIDAFQPLG